MARKEVDGTARAPSPPPSPGKGHRRPGAYSAARVGALGFREGMLSLFSPPLKRQWFTAFLPGAPSAGKRASDRGPWSGAAPAGSARTREAPGGFASGGRGPVRLLPPWRLPEAHPLALWSHSGINESSIDWSRANPELG